MSGSIGKLRQAIGARWVRWRRARNLRQGGGGGHGVRVSAKVLAAGAILACVMALGALVMTSHARQLGADAAPAASIAALDSLRPQLAGVRFDVPRQGAAIQSHGAARLVVVSGMRAEAPAEFSLCLPGPIRIAHRLAEVARLDHPGQLALAGPAAAGLPRVEVSGATSLSVRWDGAHPQARFASDGAGRTMRADAWLVWPDGALHLRRRAAQRCTAGVLAVQWHRLDPSGANPGASVTAYSGSTHASTRLQAGSYVVPAAAAGPLEDQALFEALRARGLVRLGADGLIELAPRDLPAWRRADAGLRAARLDGWDGVTLDPAALGLLERLYRMADGAYVRAQIEVFNSERRLLAWRPRPGQGGSWQASAGGAPAPSQPGMPLAGTRLFAQVPGGWAPWQRIAQWPRTAAGAPARLMLDLPPHDAGAVELMLAGHLIGVEGASVQASAACSGRACPHAAAVQILRLTPTPGARRITVSATALDMAARAGRGDDRYRHLRLSAGAPSWRALPAQQALARSTAAAPVTLSDRAGQLLWSGGAPTEAATRAGLATMLGLHAQHANSVAGMLARLPESGAAHHATLSLDLGLQTLAQAVLDCVGLRQGRWDGARCVAAGPIPAGRQAGLAIIDTGSGDILAAATSGATPVTPDNWAEVRDFDRANPAGSPLRLAAWQHDGGIHRSPGSTFKIVSALGLELAAQRDPALAGLVRGMPLAEINALARRRGFAFQTAAPAYPSSGAARISNFRDGLLDRRAVDGRLGVTQALTYSLNTWFAWTGELSDRTLLGRAEGGMPAVRVLQEAGFEGVRPLAAMAHRLGFGRTLRLDGGLLPADYAWANWDALQATPARIDPIDTRHELRQMAIGLRMQATPLQMAMVAGAVGEGALVAPRLLLALDGRPAAQAQAAPLELPLARIRAGMKGVVEQGTAAAAFREPALAAVRRGLSGKTGTAPTGEQDAATVWFTGYLEPGSLPGQQRRLALAVFISHSQATGGEHAAPVVATLLRQLARAKPE